MLAGSNTAPVLSGQSTTLAVGTSTDLKNLLTYSDAEGNAAVSYQLWDADIAGGESAYAALNGGRLGAGNALTFTAAEVTSGAADIVADQVAASPNVFWARASDGQAWSSWIEFKVAATAPAASAQAGLSQKEAGVGTGDDESVGGQFDDPFLFVSGDGDTDAQLAICNDAYESFDFALVTNAAIPTQNALLSELPDLVGGLMLLGAQAAESEADPFIF